MNFTKALKIATIFHQDQKDLGGNEYILHPFFIASQMETIDEKIVAILHDIVEDTSCTLDYLKNQEKFSNEIIDAVDAITKRENEDLLDYLTRIARNDLAYNVKLVDIKHNQDLSRIRIPILKDYERVKKYDQIREALISLRQLYLAFVKTK